MSNAYEPRRIERRWQARWETARPYRALNPGDDGFDPERPKYYVLDMFPYPSGSGLHVGHALGYVGTDIVTRKKRMQGFNVLHPMGWDAFGLPAEQYALQTGKHPAETTAENTANYRRQLKNIGMAYDWERELNTSDPRYYRWTQWLFKRLFERGLAYQTEVPVWWCEELKTVLANEEVINGRSERGNHPCVKRPLKQWMLRITRYADRLLTDLDELDWPESIKAQQREWIGRSEGAEIEFPIDCEGFAERLKIFTTRPDTLWGCTFMVLAPEHPLVPRLTSDEQRATVAAYVAEAAKKSELERGDASKAKTGVFTGSYALNPVMDLRDERARVPIWIADYVMAGYGTGAIMAVPGGDERDFEFARTYDLSIVEVCRPPGGSGPKPGVCYSGEGTAVNSGPLDGLPTAEAKLRAIELLEDRHTGQGRVQYKLRDWLFSRQRYWGEPFPLLHHADRGVSTVPDEDLPVLLPEMDDFRPAEDGSPPLARAEEWLKAVDPRTGEGVRRDTDTMPGWAGSCWYWLRFMDPHNDQAAFSKDAEAYWGPVDLYIGGAAHAVMHLLYARFWHKVLYDAGLVHTKEPFRRLFNQGMVQAFAYQDATERLVSSDEVETKGDGFARRRDGAPLTQVVTKMAKSLKNVVNPDDIIEEHGADAFRLYEMFMGPLADSKPWNPRDIPGCRRFLDRTWRLFVDESSHERARLRRPGGYLPLGGDAGSAAAVAEALVGEGLGLERELAKTLKRVEDSFEHFNFNTAIAAMMTFVNEATKRQDALTFEQAERFLRALAPFAPHIAEELWDRLGFETSITSAPWPTADERYLVEDTFELIVQVKGKLRAKVAAPRGAPEGELEALARAAIVDKLEGQEIVKAIVVPGRLVNFVTR